MPEEFSSLDEDELELLLDELELELLLDELALKSKSITWFWLSD